MKKGRDMGTVGFVGAMLFIFGLIIWFLGIDASIKLESSLSEIGIWLGSFLIAIYILYFLFLKFEDIVK